jgi:predicted amidohydrolase
LLIGVFVDVGYKGAVDFDAFYRQAADRGDGRVAGAKIV